MVSMAWHWKVGAGVLGSKGSVSICTGIFVFHLYKLALVSGGNGGVIMKGFQCSGHMPGSPSEQGTNNGGILC